MMSTRTHFGKLIARYVSGALIFVTVFILAFAHVEIARAQFNPQINYQGKLTLGSGVAVSNGTYNIRFNLYTVASGGTSLWTETRTNSNRVQVTDGLFSVLLGEVNALTGIDFNQTLYLGVEIGGTSVSPAWDGEMTPRKKLGAVPAAFYADNAGKLGGVTGDKFFRNDQQNATSSSNTFLNIVQTGAGKVAEMFGVGTTSVFTVASDGKVGIGTSSPATKLHLHNDTNSPIPAFSYTNNLAGDVATLFGIGGRSYAFGIDNSDNDSFKISTGNTINNAALGTSDLLTITSAGNVGIGTTTPGYSLTVVNGANFLRGTNPVVAAGTYALNVSVGTGAGGIRADAPSGVSAINIGGTGVLSVDAPGVGGGRFIVTDSNTVGIGTGTPSHRLTVAGDVNVTGALRFGGNAGTAGQVLLSNGASAPVWTATSSLGLGAGFFAQNGNSFGTTATLGTNDAQSLVFETNGSPRMTVLSGGNVGIGTTSPGAILDVYGTGANTDFRVSRLGTPYYTYISAPAGSPLVSHIGNSVVGNVISMVVNSGTAGFVGIGTTTPSTKLHISGTGSQYITSESTNDQAAGLILTRTGTSAGDFRIRNQGHLYFDYGTDNSTFGSTYMTVYNNGNVGIGTTTPESRLSIVGGDLSLNMGNINAVDTLNVSYLQANNGSEIYTNNTLHTNGNAIILYGGGLYAGDGSYGMTGGTLFMEGGNIQMGDGLGSGTSGGGTLLMDNGSISGVGANGGIWDASGLIPYANIDLAGYNFLVNGGIIDFGNGTTLDSSSFYFDGTNINMNNSAAITMNGGTISMNAGGGSGGGDLYMDGGQIRDVLQINATTGRYIDFDGGYIGGGDWYVYGYNFGIGTTSAAYPLTVEGDVNITGALRFNGNPGTTGQILMSNGASTPSWVATSTLGFLGASVTSSLTNGFMPRWNGSSFVNSIVRENGSVVGINATSSSYTLNVQGTAGVNPFQIASSTGTSLLVVSQNGRVGIGTSSPEAILNPNATASGALTFSITNSGNATLTGLRTYTFSDGNGGVTAYGGRVGSFASDAPNSITSDHAGRGMGVFGFSANRFGFWGGDGGTDTALEILTIPTRGAGINSVGIGTTTPLARLDVYGLAGANPAFRVSSSTNATMFVVGANGTVGIGTTTASSNLSVVGTISGSNSNGLLTYDSNSVLTIRRSTSNLIFDPAAGTAASHISTTNTGGLFLGGSSYGTHVKITSTGNVGIGTTSPTAKFSVVSTVGASPLLIASSSGQQILRINELSQLQFNYGQNHGLILGRHAPGTNDYGITQYSNKAYEFYDNDARLLSRLSGSINGGDLLFTVGSVFFGPTVRFTVDQANQKFTFEDGNVGIGTTTPTSKLTIGSGQIEIPLGSTTAPSLSFTNDLNTGIWSGGADTLNFSTGGIRGFSLGSNQTTTFGGIVDANDYVTVSNNGMLKVKNDDPFPNEKALLTLEGPYGSMIFYGTHFTTPNINLADSTNLFLVRGGGNVHIGPYAGNPASKLAIAGNVAVGVSYSLLSAPTNGLIVEGDVGIGSSTPSQKLSVAGNISFTGALMPGNNAGTLNQLLVSQGSGNAPQWQNAGTVLSGIASTTVFLQGGNSFGTTATLGTNDAQSLVFETNNTARIGIDSSGNVGIGTTTPQDAFHVIGSSFLQGNAIIGTQSLYVGDDSTTIGIYGPASLNAIATYDVVSGEYFFAQSSIYRNASGLINIGQIGTMGAELTVAHSGVATNIQEWKDSTDGLVAYVSPIGLGYFDDSIGISSTTPAGKLGIEAGSGTGVYSVGSTAGYFRSNDANGYSLYSQQTTSGFNIYANGGKSYFSGNVGIATTSPTARLHIEPGSANIGMKISAVPGQAAVLAQFLGTTNTFTVRQTGEPLISGNGSMYFNTTSFGIRESSGLEFNSVGAAHPMKFNVGTSAIERMRILTSGEVGIGTTTPTKSLTVVGEGYFSSTVTTSGLRGLNGQYVIDLNSGEIQQNTFSVVDLNSGELLVPGVGTAIDWTNKILYDNSGFSVLNWASGNIGISTSTPGYRLVVAGDTNITGALRFNGNPGTAGNILMSNGASTPSWVATSTLGFLGASVTSSLTNGFMPRWNGSALVNSIVRENGSVVGINATSSSYTLNVQGTAGVNPFQIASSTGASLLVVSQNGRVGIGTTNPGYPLEVTGRLRSTTGYVLGNDLGLFPVVGGQSVVQTHWAMQLSGNTQVVPGSYTPANVGVGVSEYHVVAPMVNSGAAGLAVLGVGSQTKNYFEVTSNANKTNASWRGDVFNITAAGNVGIGSTTPSAKLTVAGQVLAQYFTATSTTVASNFPLASTTVISVSDRAVLGNVGDETIIGAGYIQANSVLNITSSLGYHGYGGSNGLNYSHEFYGDVYFDTDINAYGSAFFNNDVTILGALYDANSSSGSAGMVLRSSGTGTEWVATSTLGFLGASVTSSLTNGFMPRWNGSALVNSIVRENGSVVGINATSSSYTLNVQGTAGVNPFQIASSTGASLLAVGMNGNVGIGTNAPADLLHVRRDVAGSSYQARYENGTGGGTAGFILRNTSGWDIRFRTNPNNGWFEIADSSNNIQHRWTGKNYLLASDGMIGFSSQTNFATALDGARDVAFRRNAAGVIEINSGTASTWRDLIARNIMLGTSTAFATLAVQGQPGATPAFAVASSTGARLLTVAANGRVGVGSTTPGALLAVDTTNTSNPNDRQNVARFNGSNAGASTDAVIVSVSGTYEFFSPGNNIYGVRSEPKSNAFVWSAADNNYAFYGNPSGGTVDWGIYLTGEDRNYFSGSVGIGTTTPAAKLSVAGGDVHVNGGNLYMNKATGFGGGNLHMEGGVIYFDSLGSTLTPSGGDILMQAASGNIFISSNVDLSGMNLSTVSDGSASAPGLSFASGSNIGLYSASNGLGLSTGGSSRLFITSAGNVGIGTTTPGSKFSVAGNATVGSAYATVAAPTNGLIVEGSVGIGSTTPSAKLVVENGNIALSHTSGIKQQLLLNYDGIQYFGDLYQYYGNTLSAVISPKNNSYVNTQGGNFGIGSSTPSQKLSVAGNISFTGALMPGNNAGTLNQLLVSQGSGNTPQWQNAASVLSGIASTTVFLQGGNSFGTTATLGTNDAQSLVFETNGMERARLDTNGNFAVGTSSPIDERVTVQTMTPATVGINVYGLNDDETFQPLTGDLQRWSVFDVNYGNPFVQTLASVGARGQMRAATGTAALPSLSFQSDQNTGLYSVVADTIGFSTGGSERMRLTSAGSLAIGTTTAPEKLTVEGNMRFTGVATAYIQGQDRFNNATGTSLVLSGGAGTNSGGGAIVTIGGAAGSLGGKLTLSDGQSPTSGTGGGVDIITQSGNFAGNIRILAGGGVTAGAISIIGGGAMSGNGHVIIQPGSNGNVIVATTTGALSVGTTTATKKFNVAGGALFGAENEAWTFDDGVNARLGFIKKGGTSPQLVSASAQPIIFSQSNASNMSTTAVSSQTLTERMRIHTNGNVGIGTSTPVAKLSVTGTAGAGEIFTIASSTNNRLFTVAANGNVGIGISNPGQLLEVMGNISLPNTSGLKSIYTWAPTDANWRIGMNNNPGFTRALATSHVQYVTYAGGAGQGFAVGVNGGNSSFEVQGSDHRAYFRGNVGVATTTSAARLSVVGAGTGTGLTFQTTGSTGVTGFATYDNGRVAVGRANPSAQFEVQNTAGTANFTVDPVNGIVNINNPGGGGGALNVLPGSSSVLINASAYGFQPTYGTGVNVSLNSSSPVTVSDLDINGTYVTLNYLDTEVTNVGYLYGNRIYIDGPYSGTAYLYGTYQEIYPQDSNQSTYGTYTNISGPGDIFGSVANVYNSSGATNAYGYYANVSGAQNNYGLHITADKNYLNGALGIGSTSPSARLSVTGTAGTGDVFAVASSTNARMFTVAASGNVGIGSSTPSERLSIAGNISFTGALMPGNNAGTLNQLLVSQGSGNAPQWQNAASVLSGIASTTVFLQGGNSFGATALLGTNDNNALALETNGSVRMSISNAGKISVGTTTAYDLFSITASASTTAFSLLNGSVPVAKLDVDQYGSAAFHMGDRIRLSSFAGSPNYIVNTVSIGTTTSSGQLNVEQSGIASQVARFYQSNSLVSGAVITGISRLSGTNALLDLYSDNGATSVMKVLANGYVGIGTTSPTTALHVESTVTGGRVAYYRSNAGSNPNTQFVLDSPTNFNSGLVLQENLSDRFGIFYNSNTTSGNRLADTWELYSFVSSQPVIRVHQSAGNVLNIDSSGNVGIGTTTPGSLLTVAGTSSLRTVLPEGPYASNISNYSLGSSGARWSNVWAEYVNVGTSTWSIAGRSSGGVDRFAIFDGPSGSGTERFGIANNGRIGVGTSTMDALFGISEQNGSFSSALGISKAGGGDGLRIVASGIDQTVYGVRTDVTLADNCDACYAAYGGYFNVQSNGAWTPTEMIGLYANANSGNGIGIGVSGEGDQIGVLGVSSDINGSGISGSAYGDAGKAINAYANGQYSYGLRVDQDGAAATSYGIYVEGGRNYIENALGVGSSSPAAKLSVVGSGSTNPFMVASSTGASLFTVRANGNVGIGTNSPVAPLDVRKNAGEIAVFGSMEEEGSGYLNIQGFEDVSMKMGINWDALGDGQYRGYVDTESADGFDIAVGGVRRLSVGNNGNLGIGTTSPFAKLDIYGTPGSAPAFRVSSSTNASLFQVSANGNVGIGTSTPANRLTVQVNSIGDGFTVNGDSTNSPQFSLARAGVQRAAFGITLANGHYSNLAVAGDAVLRSINGTGGTLRIANQQSGNIAFQGGSNGSNDVVWATISSTTLALSNSSLTLNNGTANRIFYGGTGVAAPANGSAGQKIQLFGTSGTVGIADYALGIESGNMWFSSGGGYKFYNNAGTRIFEVTGSGITTVGVNAWHKSTDGNDRLWYNSGGTTYLKSPVVSGTGVAHEFRNSVDGVTARIYGNGQLGVADGTVSLPSHTFINDTNTGMYSGGADILRFSTGGTERMAIHSNGNVGIGSSTPSSKVSIVGTAGGSDILTIASSTGAALFRVDASGRIINGNIRALASTGTLIEANNGTDVALFGISGGSGSTFYGGITGMDSITSAGNTNVNTTLLSNEALNVYSPADYDVFSNTYGGYFQNNAGMNSYINYNDQSSCLAACLNANFYSESTSEWDFYGNGASYFDTVTAGTSISSSGNITSSGNLIGQRVLTNAGSQTAPAYSFSSDQNTGIYGNNSDLIGFSTNSQPRMVIGSTGLVGIGTTTPVATLTIQGTSTLPTTSVLTVASSSGASLFTVSPNGNVTMSSTFTNGSASITSIGVITAALIQTSGGVSQFRAGNAYTFTASQNESITRPTTNALAFNTAGSESMRIVSGLVGIGSTTPTATLVVQGTSTLPTTPLFRVASSTGASLLTVSANGNVGIGTNAPAQLLHVYRNSDGAPVRFEDTNGYCEINPTSTTWTCTSDERLKKDVVTIGVDDALAKIKDLRPVTFKWNNQATDDTRFGLIAQEVERVYPDFVQTDEKGFKSVSYGSFTPILIAAIKKLDDRITSLEEAVIAARNTVAETSSNGVFALLQAGVGKFRTIEVEEGIQIRDKLTGQQYCVTIAGGEWLKQQGRCADIAHEDNPVTPPDEGSLGEVLPGETAHASSTEQTASSTPTDTTPSEVSLDDETVSSGGTEDVPSPDEVSDQTPPDESTSDTAPVSSGDSESTGGETEGN